MEAHHAGVCGKYESGVRVVQECRSAWQLAARGFSRHRPIPPIARVRTARIMLHYAVERNWFRSRVAGEATESLRCWEGFCCERRSGWERCWSW